MEVVGKQTATIAVTVNRETSARISADDFKAVADFQDMYQDTQVPVTVTCMTEKFPTVILILGREASR